MLEFVPRIFHDAMRRIPSDIHGVTSYIDGILIVVVEEEAHDGGMAKVLQRLEDYDFHINSDKM